MSERSRPTWPTRRLPLTSDTPTVARLTDGAAFQRVHAALLAHGRHVRQAGPRLAVSCPGPGHWRSDQVPSLVVTAADGRVLMNCHAGCHTKDVLKAIGLTPADLYDEPHRPAVERPGRAALHEAIGAARGLAVADRYLYLQLLCRSDWDTATIPARFQPKSQRDLATQTGLDRATVEWATTHLARHGWLTLTCGRPGCGQTGPHSGRGHRLAYSLHFGQDCPGGDCRPGCRTHRKAATHSLSVLSLSAVLGLTCQRLSPPSPCPSPKTAGRCPVFVPNSAFYLCAMQPLRRSHDCQEDPRPPRDLSPAARRERRPCRPGHRAAMTGPIEHGNGARPIVRQCVAHVPSGRRCRRSALRGAVVCWVHGGAAGQVRRAAERRVAEAGALAAFERYRGPDGDSGMVDVVAELSRLVARVTAFADFAAARIEALTAEQWAAFSPRTAAEVAMFERACDQARRLLRDTAQLGLAEKAMEAEARLSEAMGARIAHAVARIVVRLGHPDPMADRETGLVCREELEQLLAATGDGG